MVLPGESEQQIALFSIARVRPSPVWIIDACKRATQQDDGPPPLVYVNESEVDTAGWSLQRVAEWVVENIAREEDPRASMAFVAVDDKSKVTDSLLIVTIGKSSFDFPNADKYAAAADDDNDDDEDDEEYRQQFRERIIRHHQDIASRYPEPNSNPKIVIERAYRASPELCALYACLFHGQIRNPWDYIIDEDNPDDLDAIERGVAAGPKAEEEEYYCPCLIDYRGELVKVTETHYEWKGVFKGEAFSSTSYRLSNGMFLATEKPYPFDTFDKLPFPKVDLKERGIVTILGPFDPNRSSSGKM